MATKEIEIHTLLSHQVEQLIKAAVSHVTDGYKDAEESVRLEASLRRAVAKYLLDWGMKMEAVLGEPRQ